MKPLRLAPVFAMAFLLMGLMGLTGFSATSANTTASPPDACLISGILTLDEPVHFTLICIQQECDDNCTNDQPFTFQPQGPSGPTLTGYNCRCQGSASTHCCQVIEVNDSPYAYGQCNENVCPMTGPKCQLDPTLDPSNPPHWIGYNVICTNSDS